MSDRVRVHRGDTLDDSLIALEQALVAWLAAGANPDAQIVLDLDAGGARDLVRAIRVGRLRMVLT